MPLPRAALAIALACTGGCAATRPPRATVAVRAVETPVRIEGLGFLRLAMPRNDALAEMHAAGYVCREESPAQRHVPCVLLDGRRPPAPSVMSFAGGALTEVWSLVPVRDGSGRQRFNRLWDDGSRRYPYGVVERRPASAVARFLPGDGSTLELRHAGGDRSIAALQYRPSQRESSWMPLKKAEPPEESDPGLFEGPAPSPPALSAQR